MRCLAKEVKHAAVAAGLGLAVLLGAGRPAAAQGSGDDRNVVFRPELFDALSYRLIGPYRGGRSTAVTGVNDRPHLFYMGTTGGGVWKTTDAGQTWENVSDGFFDVASIGSIDVADSDRNVIYVGTGTGDTRGNTSTGRGVYKSENGGKTWRFAGLREAGQIGRIATHPTNPDLVYLAALGRGAYTLFDDLNTRWNVVRERLQQILDVDVPALNEALQRLGVPAVTVPGRRDRRAVS